MPLKLVLGENLEGRQLHQCHICKRYGIWDENWSWFGSYKDLDDEKIYKFCSKACRKKGTYTIIDLQKHLRP